MILLNLVIRVPWRYIFMKRAVDNHSDTSVTDRSILLTFFSHSTNCSLFDNIHFQEVDAICFMHFSTFLLSKDLRNLNMP